MEKIKVQTQKSISLSREQLRKDLEVAREKYQTEKTFYNTEAPLLWIIRGGIDYFSSIDSNFLGSGNASGIPDMEADYFANNLYRFINAIDYLAKLWKIELNTDDELDLLLDIRTLIVHSGEQLSNIKSVELQGYKDCQLGRILKKSDHNFIFNKEFLNFEYAIVVWNDKHDQQKSRKLLSEVDYNQNKENQKDIYIYLDSETVKKIMLSYLEGFLSSAQGKSENQSFKKFPDIKDRVIKLEESKREIDFDKIAELVSKTSRGGYSIEQGVHHWYGFGLQKLLNFIKGPNILASLEVTSEVENIIYQTISQYWDDYQNIKINNEEIISLDIRDVFRKHIPNFSDKDYLFGEKLFLKIAPGFNSTVLGDLTDIDYFLKLLSSLKQIEGINLNLEMTVDDLICDFIVQCVQLGYRNKSEKMSKDLKVK